MALAFYNHLMNDFVEVCLKLTDITLEDCIKLYGLSHRLNKLDEEWEIPGRYEILMKSS